MSISTIQDALDSFIEATLSGYKRLSDSNDIGDNPNVYLNKGYASAFGSAESTGTEFCGGLTFTRVVTVALTNTYNASLDAERRKDLEQSLMIDHEALMLALEYNRDLGGVCINASYESDNGLEYIVDETYNKQYIGIFSEIKLQYSVR